MFRRISESLPAVTVGALIVTALFNIGFFNRVGMNFLGVVDLTNVVYSFGLAFGLLLTVAAVVGQIYLEERTKIKDYQVYYRQFSHLTFYVRFALVVASLLLLIPWYSNFIRPAASPTGYMLVVFFLAALMGGQKLLFAYRAVGSLPSGEVASIVIVTCILVVTAGAYVAQSMIFDSRTYTVISKNGVLTGARIVRSSSTGFIMALDGVIQFIPSGEIKQIRAEETLPSPN